jgi:hypothetical protein
MPGKQFIPAHYDFKKKSNHLVKCTKTGHVHPVINGVIKLKESYCGINEFLRERHNTFFSAKSVVQFLHVKLCVWEMRGKLLFY